MVKQESVYYITSESVTEGHPDKICDQISDAILDNLISQDPYSRVAIECLTTTGTVHVAGEVTTKGYVNVQKIVRETLREIGYTNPLFGIDADDAGVWVSIHGQSPDIALGVDENPDANKDQGAGDQGMMYGFACNETPELMPFPIITAHRLTRRMAEVRKKGIINELGPDGKSQVSVRYKNGRPEKIIAVVIAQQHTNNIDEKELREKIIKNVVEPICRDMIDDETKIYVNATGRFVIGGPEGDTGVTGRKIIVDTYGGVGRHGGGCFSGKDPSKVDRSGAYMSRHIAKNIVAAGLSDKCEVQVSYSIGIAKPTSLNIDTFGTGKISDEKIKELVEKHFDLRPKAIITYLNLRRPIFKKTAAYGHFGRSEEEFTWEHTNKAEILKKESGI